MTPVDLCHFGAEEKKKRVIAMKKSSLAIDLMENEKNSVRQNLLGDSALNVMKERKNPTTTTTTTTLMKEEKKKEYEKYRASYVSTYVTSSFSSPERMRRY